MERSIEARAAASVAGCSVQSSSAMAMSERSASCMSMESSGVSRTSLPSIGERKRTPSSLSVRRLLRLNTWKPPESVRIGRAPVHEAVQAAVRCDHLRPRAQQQMEGVAEDDLRAQLLELLGRHGLHGAVGPHGHEGRRLDRPVRGDEAPDTRRPVARFDR